MSWCGSGSDLLPRKIKFFEVGNRTFKHFMDIFPKNLPVFVHKKPRRPVSRHTESQESDFGADS